ncbi:pp2c [Cystoisospora suis]|uniref:Pp2c n=1 Tax=Cystoisospora suis TaxID=483139 RepID=A0A2C6KN61_9APIC|nr:pp2c [Cystoisospora suis]
MPHLHIRRTFRVPGASRVLASLTKRPGSATRTRAAAGPADSESPNNASVPSASKEEEEIDVAQEQRLVTDRLRFSRDCGNRRDSFDSTSGSDAGRNLSDAVADMADKRGQGSFPSTDATMPSVVSAASPAKDSLKDMLSHSVRQATVAKDVVQKQEADSNPFVSVTTRTCIKASLEVTEGRLPVRPVAGRPVQQNGRESVDADSGPGHTKTSAGHQSRRAAAAGKLTSKKERPYQEKARLFLNGEVSAALFVELGIATSCRKGLKKGFFNQDDFFSYQCDEWGLYGVFDGHGPGGHLVANFVQWHLPNIIHEYMITHEPRIALHMAFVRVDNMLKDASETQKFDSASSGSTASVVLHRRQERKLFFAHVGDSRIVLARRNSQLRLVPECVTKDHKPDDPVERARIEEHGGEVRRPTGHIPYRVFLKGRNYPGLAMSRSIGDSVGHCAGVTPEPDILDFDLLEDRDDVVIMCTDGVWEFITPEEAVEIVSRYDIYQAEEAAQELSREAWKRWLEQDGHSVDDITVQIIHLFPPPHDNHHHRG